VVVDESLVRKVDSHFTRADSSKLLSQLGWRPKVDFFALVTMMVEERIRLLRLSRSTQPASE
jgi:GDPmannose 4,6-dehydratase